MTPLVCALTQDEVMGYLDVNRDAVYVGNFAKPQFLAGRTYDVVLADYLLAAVETVSPHYQDSDTDTKRPTIYGVPLPDATWR